MSITKARIAKSIDLLTHEVQDVAAIAKSQRQSADKQHENAHRLEVIGEALTANAADLKAELKKM